MATSQVDRTGVGGGAGAAAVTPLERAAVARETARVAAGRGVPLFVGNGFLTREVAHLADADQNFYLFGGMGLATSVAHGYRQATGDAAVVLEGEGNFAMGLGGALHSPAAAGAPLVHVVVFNGRYESSGGQSAPLRSPAQVVEIAGAFGYRHAWLARTEEELRGRLAEAAALAEGAALLCAHTAESSPVAPRPTLTAADCTERFTTWRQRREQEQRHG